MVTQKSKDRDIYTVLLLGHQTSPRLVKKCLCFIARARPPLSKKFLAWNLSIVLQVFPKTLFEPIDECFEKN